MDDNGFDHEKIPLLRPPADIARRKSSGVAMLCLLAGLLLSAASALPALAAATDQGRTFTATENTALHAAKYIYIASTRKDGSLSKPAEIWFRNHDGAVYVGTSPESWRARRIGWGRPQAKIWIGSREGPSFEARGTIVREPDQVTPFCDAIAKKYPDSWPKYEKRFREGLKDGQRVMIRYTPMRATPKP
ncbi:MAG: hypothetical protein VCC00_11010 [Deltaproteobacteria bacterium]